MGTAWPVHCGSSYAGSVAEEITIPTTTQTQRAQECMTAMRRAVLRAPLGESRGIDIGAEIAEERAEER